MLRGRRRYQESKRLDRLKEIETRVMKEISKGNTILLSAIVYWIQMTYGVHSKTANEYLETLEGGRKFTIDRDAGFILPLGWEEEPEAGE